MVVSKFRPVEILRRNRDPGWYINNGTAGRCTNPAATRQDKAIDTTRRNDYERTESRDYSAGGDRNLLPIALTGSKSCVNGVEIPARNRIAIYVNL